MAKLKATISPLQGKYYGTDVDVRTVEGTSLGTVRVWLAKVNRQNPEVSKRQLRYWRFSSEEEAVEHGFPCNCHYETQTTYNIAAKVCELINAGHLVATPTLHNKPNG